MGLQSGESARRSLKGRARETFEMRSEGSYPLVALAGTTSATRSRRGASPNRLSLGASAPPPRPSRECSPREGSCAFSKSLERRRGAFCTQFFFLFFLLLFFFSSIFHLFCFLFFLFFLFLFSFFHFFHFHFFPFFCLFFGFFLLCFFLFFLQFLCVGERAGSRCSSGTRARARGARASRRARRTPPWPRPAPSSPTPSPNSARKAALWIFICTLSFRLYYFNTGHSQMIRFSWVLLQ